MSDSTFSSHDLVRQLTIEQFPRSSSYNPKWVIENMMGPNVLWLTEYVTQSLDLRAGMRVLDMGCGKAISSIFLAREFGVEVWATDLWIPADENRRRIEAAGLQDRVFPIHAEAHSLPFAHDFFDVAVSMDAYQYFGTDDLYLGYYSRFLKSEGQLGLVVPSLTREAGSEIPPDLIPHWHCDFCSFHTPDWWRTHWEKTGLVQDVTTEWMPDGQKLWLKWEETVDAVRGLHEHSSVELLHADADRYLGFTRVTARRRDVPLYKP